MATKKSTTSAKTKTAKKTVKKPAKTVVAKARTSKVSTKVTAVKAVAKQAPKVKTNRLTFLTLERIWLASAALFVLLAAAAAFLMQSKTYMLTQTHLTQDSLLSQQGAAFISAAKPVVDLDLRWALVALLALSTVLPILYLTKLKAYYANRVASRRVIEGRWIDLAVTSGLMVQIIAILCGYSDIATLKLMAGAIALTSALGWLAEQQNENAKRPVWTAFALSIVAGVGPWVAIGLAKTFTALFGEVRSPWYVYALCATTLVGFTLLALNQYNQHRRFREWADYAVVERNYALISTATKVAFAAILIVGLAK